MKKNLRFYTVIFLSALTAVLSSYASVCAKATDEMIVNRYSFDTSFDYVVVSEEDYRASNHCVSDPFEGMNSAEKKVYVEKVNSDFKGKIFDEKGSPLSAYYVDYYTYFGMKRSSGGEPVYVEVRAFDSEGHRIYGAGFPKDRIDDGVTYVPVTEKLMDETRQIVDYDEAVEFIGAEIKTPGYIPKGYTLSKIIADDKFYEKPFRKMVFMWYVNEKDPDRKFIVFCEKVNKIDNPAEVYPNKEPTKFKSNGKTVYEFFFPNTRSGSMYK